MYAARRGTEEKLQQVHAARLDVTFLLVPLPDRHVLPGEISSLMQLVSLPVPRRSCLRGG